MSASVQPAPAPETSATPEVDPCARIRDKIVHVLTHFPILSPSMLQVGIGPNTPPRQWHPELDRLIREGKVLRETKGVEDAAGQYRSITRISLAPSPEPSELVDLTEASDDSNI